jgi:CubicO group peptidase (beta-lactamase class C family)
VAKGYGVRTLGDAARVDAQTLFGIASNTKAFTATALGLLVEEHKIEWDAPVVRYLPGFAMWDPFVTRELTVRDLLVHRSGFGLGAGDLLWWPESTYSRKEIARRLRFIPPATSFRSAYAYDNVLYLIAGELIETISGQTWEDFISARILAKAGMSGSYPRYSAAAASGRVATPHARIEGKVRPIAPFGSDNTNPAGGIYSSPEDMAEMAAGPVVWWKARRRLAAVLRRHLEAADRHRDADSDWRRPSGEMAALKMHFHGYALGFDVRDYRGHKVIMHTGGLPGFVSRVAMIPDLGVGVAVLTNQESGAAFESIAFHVLDHYLGAPAVDWIEAYKTATARADAANAEAERRAATSRETASKPSLAPAKYAGTYRDAWYGDVTIAEENGKLVMRFSHTPLLVGDLEHWQHDTFVVRWRDRELRADAYVTFALNPDGSIDQAKMRAVSPATDFSFDFQDLLLKPARP